MYCESLPILTADVVLLTANQRLAFHLQQKFSLSASQIFSFEAWLIFLWQQQAHNKILLSEFQEWSIWQEIIRTSTTSISQWRETASLAQQAWQRLHQWNLSIDDINQYPNEEVQTFIQWTQQFQTQLQQRKWLTLAELPAQLAQMSGIQWPKQIVLAGFDELTPVLQKLFTAISNFTTVIPYQPQQISADITRIALADEKNELMTMARFVKQQFMDNETLRIGCLIPDLANKRASVWHTFTQVFAAEELLPGAIRKPSVFNISASQQLINYPLIQAGLNCLSLTPQNINFSQLSQILLSPYINSSTDDAAYGAMLEINLRETKQNNFVANLITPLLHKVSTNYPAATFTNRWQQWQTNYRNDHELLLSEWSTQFALELSSLGWPGQHNTDADEQQLIQRWQQLLTEELIATATDSKPCSRQAALKRLHALANFTLFQPKTTMNAPIQILGLLEASGCEFDLLWIMGLEDQSWPAAVKPNPFLPINLQRQHNMPHASAKRQYQYTQRLQQRLLNSAPRVLLSHSEQKDDQRLRPSRMILEFPVLNVENLKLANDNNLAKLVWQHRAIESLIDDQAPALMPDEKIRGGSSILQHQSVCPFRAFAKIRLNAQFPAIPSVGLHAADRGNLMHAVLDQIWKQLKSQQQLLQLPEIELQQLITASVHKILQQQTIPESLFKRTEIKRLIRLVHHWLSIEKDRPEFQVTQRETTRHVTIGPLNLRVKIDRVDQLTDNKYFIIDYKSTIAYSSSDWFNQRLSDIQLPLYCAFGIENTVGIAYAQVQNGRMKFMGLMHTSDPAADCFSAIQPYTGDWLQTQKQWQVLLKNLAVDFSIGKASVDPIDADTTCKHCDLQPLCRIGCN
jgi:probable DNA repair protein